MADQYLIYDTELSDIASAIRDKIPETNRYYPREMDEAIGRIPESIDSLLFSILNRTVVSINDSAGSVTFLGARAFMSCSNLLSVYLPVCSMASYQAFSNCSSLQYVNIGLLSIAGVVGGSGYSYEEGATFYMLRSLQTLICSQCQSIGFGGVSMCSRLTSISFPVCVTLDSQCFAYDSALTSVTFPAVTLISNQAFDHCTSLRTASFPALRDIYSFAFRSCSSMTSLYLMGSAVVSFNGYSVAFGSSPFYDGSGLIYVPASLYNTYLTTYPYGSSHFRSA